MVRIGDSYFLRSFEEGEQQESQRLRFLPAARGVCASRHLGLSLRHREGIKGLSLNLKIGICMQGVFRNYTSDHLLPISCPPLVIKTEL